MNAEPFQRAWAKLAVAPDARRLWHSLVAHGIDVAATFEALCETPAIRLRLQAAAERTLSRRDVARLGVFAALHDFGKANRGFWGRQFDPGDLRRERDAGHIAETRGALYGPAAARAQEALGFERIADWGGALVALIIATLSHHGSPAASRIRKDVVSPADLALWSAAGSYDPIRELERLRDAAFAMFPEAFAEGPPLPDAPRFVHLFAGLLMLADWIGSDPASFPLGNGDDADRIAFARGRAPALLADFGIAHLHGRPRRTTGGFEALFGWPPRALQEALGRIGDEPLVILEAETGSGKTEAALWHFVGLLGAGLVDGLYFALPTRVAAAEIHGRVTRAADALFGEGAVKPVLAVPGYIRAGAVEGRPLPEFRVLWPLLRQHSPSEGSPACAGIEPVQSALRRQGRWLPRMRGDRPHVSRRPLQRSRAPPHARGSTCPLGGRAVAGPGSSRASWTVGPLPSGSGSERPGWRCTARASAPSPASAEGGRPGLALRRVLLHQGYIDPWPDDRIASLELR